MSGIHSACRDGNLKFVEKWLKSADCDVNEKDATGWTPLHCALYGKHYNIANLLLQNPDVCVLCVNQDLSTPLHFAVRSRGPPTTEHQVTLDALLDRGALLNAQQMSGYTPLHEAIDKGHILTVSWLVSKGADLNIQSKRGQTPLHNCAIREHTEMASILVEQGANVNIKDGEGKYCYEHGNNTVLKNLLYGFSLDHLTDIGSQWDCGETEISRGLNFFINFSTIAEHTNFVNMDMLSSLFSPIEKEYCISFVSDLMQVAIPPLSYDGKHMPQLAEKLDIWASCDFCQAMRFLVYADYDLRVKILADKYRDKHEEDLITVVLQKASSLSGLFSVCNLSCADTTMIERFCEKLAASKLKSTIADWNTLIGYKKEIKKLVHNRNPPKFPILMGTPQWEIMFSFMIGIEFMLMKTSTPNTKDIEASTQVVAPNLSFTVAFPALSQTLRKQFGVKEEQFMSALGASSFLTRLFMFYNLLPFSSRDGKQEFFYSANPKILLRQIEKEEYEMYFRLFPSYAAHFDKNIYSFLPKILGLFSMMRSNVTTYFVSEQNMFPRSVGNNNKLTAWGIKTPSNSLDIGYLMKAQLMERLEVDATLLQKAGIFNYQLLVGKLKAKKKEVKKFNDDWGDISKWRFAKARSEAPVPNILTDRKKLRASSMFNVKEEQQLFPTVESGLLVPKEDRLYFFRLVFRCGKVDSESPRRFKKISRIVPHFYKQVQLTDQVVVYKQNFLRAIETCFK